MATVHATPIHTLVVGVFDDAAKAKAAVEELRRAGVDDDNVDCTCGGERPRIEAPNELSPDGRGDWLDDEIGEGHTVVAVHNADERADDVRDLLRKHGATIREPSPIGSYGTGLPATPF